jgi:hypothetical protein
MSEYSNIVEYRVHLKGPEVQNGGSSGYKEIELVLDEDLKKLPNSYKLEERLRILISSNTGEIADRIWSIKVKKSSELTKSNNSDSLSSESRNTKSSLIGSGISSISKGISNHMDKINAEEEAKEEKEKAFISSKIDEISNIQLSTDKDELENQLSELLSYGSTIPSSQLQIRKAIYNKSLLALNRLKQTGSTSVSVFEEQVNKVKPKWYHKLGHFFDS